jgi:hypothetical protein
MPRELGHIASIFAIITVRHETLTRSYLAASGRTWLPLPVAEIGP